MSQLPLFPRPRAVPTQRQPDLAYIRKSLHALLRIARDAQIMPWSESEIRSWEKQFPELAAALPSQEADELVCEFKSELTRLRSAA